MEGALQALFRAGYPREWAEIKRRFDEAPEGPDKEKARAMLSSIFGGDSLKSD